MGFISRCVELLPRGAVLCGAFWGALCAPVGSSRADEGMWPLHSPPVEAWKTRYKFEPTPEWLHRLQRASVKTGDGGSGAFVSEHGLLLTNQHVARGQIHKLATDGRDLVRDGFYARTLGEELRCPDFEVSILESYEDVSARVRADVKPGQKDADAHALRDAAETAPVPGYRSTMSSSGHVRTASRYAPGLRP